jgi:hypothetical protein
MPKFGLFLLIAVTWLAVSCSQSITASESDVAIDKGASAEVGESIRLSYTDPKASRYPAPLRDAAFMGRYNSSTQYVPGDLITYEGSLYQITQINGSTNYSNTPFLPGRYAYLKLSSMSDWLNENNLPAYYPLTYYDAKVKEDVQVNQEGIMVNSIGDHLSLADLIYRLFIPVPYLKFVGDQSLYVNVDYVSYAGQPAPIPLSLRQGSVLFESTLGQYFICINISNCEIDKRGPRIGQGWYQIKFTGSDQLKTNPSTYEIRQGQTALTSRENGFLLVFAIEFLYNFAPKNRLIQLDSISYSLDTLIMPKGLILQGEIGHPKKSSLQVNKKFSLSDNSGLKFLEVHGATIEVDAAKVILEDIDGIPEGSFLVANQSEVYLNSLIVRATDIDVDDSDYEGLFVFENSLVEIDSLLVIEQNAGVLAGLKPIIKQNFGELLLSNYSTSAIYNAQNPIYDLISQNAVVIATQCLFNHHLKLTSSRGLISSSDIKHLETNLLLDCSNNVFRQIEEESLCTADPS